MKEVAIAMLQFFIMSCNYIFDGTINGKSLILPLILCLYVSIKDFIETDKKIRAYLSANKVSSKNTK